MHTREVPNTGRIRPRRTLSSLAGAAAATACWLALSVAPASAAITPETLQGGWDPNPQLGCDLNAGGSCTSVFDVSTRGLRESTWARSVEHGLDGSFLRSCDLEQHFRLVIASKAFADAGGSGRVSCAVQFSFTDGSSMNGTIEGTQVLSRDGDTSAALDSKYVITILSGTGAFASEVGSGTLAWTERYTVDTVGHEPKPSGGTDTGTGKTPVDKNPAETKPTETKPTDATPKSSLGALTSVRTLALHRAGPAGTAASSTAQGKGGWRLKLQKGAARAGFVTTGIVRRSNGAKERLRVAGAENATCTARARHGGQTVDLLGARIRHGVGVFPASLATQLSKGSWNVTGSCRSARGTATAKTTLTVT